MKRFFARLGVGLVLSLAALGATYLWYARRMTTPVSMTPKPVEVVVDSGMTWDDAADRLASLGLVENRTLFGLRARQRHRRVPLRAGIFIFDTSWTPDKLMDKLAAGPDGDDPDAPLVVQIIPGENLFRVREKLQQLGIRGDLFGFDRDRKSVDDLGVGAPWPVPAGAYSRLEGYLYPDSYYLDRKSPTLAGLLKAASKRFRTVWNDVRTRHADGRERLARLLNLTDHDFVTVASLIEKETQVKDEAPMVAAVFYNRLRRKERLATDPTLVYGPDTWKDVPSPTHRRNSAHPYNTYARVGLPPGPICSPSETSLIAALDPAETDALFFVAKRDGSGRHAFAATYEEHKANVDKYLRQPAAAKPGP